MLNIYPQKISYLNCFFRKKINEFNRNSFENSTVQLEKKKKNFWAENIADNRFLLHSKKYLNSFVFSLSLNHQKKKNTSNSNCINVIKRKLK